MDFSGSWNHIAVVWGNPKVGSTLANPPANGDGTSTSPGTTLATADSGATFMSMAFHNRM